ncbi:hypothetical protein HU200_053792 [Digitaria exilis]|uniref:L-ascorbate peroxidase n=1 Tax=Digitaria exilis TaxID=1010633 RepID=A0A835ANJ5_9POAL|nr:hypothetical protein HU200_053792 [Digitaria exilis]
MRIQSNLFNVRSCTPKKTRCSRLETSFAFSTPPLHSILSLPQPFSLLPSLSYKKQSTLLRSPNNSRATLYLFLGHLLVLEFFICFHTAISSAAMSEEVAPVVDAEYMAEIERARRDLRALIANKNCAPIMLRLAYVLGLMHAPIWHDAGTYDAKTKTGGPNGSIRFPEEYNHGANKGIKIAIDLVEPIKQKHPKITYADLYQVTHNHIYRLLRCILDSSVCPEEGRLPDAKKGASHLREVFYRMGLSDKDIVALSGGHTLGRARPERSGFDGAWTKDPLKFDNSYFVELLKGDSEGLLKLPTDKVLVEDPEFRRYVELYAKDEEAFFRDYAESHKKLSELGFTPPRSALSRKSGNQQKSLLVQAAAGVAVAAAVVAWALLCESNKKLG